MKKCLASFLLILTLMLAMAGCSAANAISALDAAEDRLEDKLDTIEDSAEHAVRKAVTPAPAPTEAPTAAPESPEAASGTTVTQAQAENIALEYAGFTADQVTRLRTEYEIDDGIPQYDVSFYEGDWEYEFEISAMDGKILSYDKDHKYD